MSFNRKGYFDLEISLMPSSPLYKLDKSQTLSWKTCELKVSPDDKPRIIQYAELSSIIIKQTNKKDTHVHFAQKLHTLIFKIKYNVCLNIYDRKKDD